MALMGNLKMWPAFWSQAGLVCVEQKEKLTPPVMPASTGFHILVSVSGCNWPRLNSPETSVESKTRIVPSSTRTPRNQSSRSWKSSAAYVTKARACDWELGQQKLRRVHCGKK